MKRLFSMVALLALTTLCAVAAPKGKAKIVAKPQPYPAAQTHIDGRLGNRIDACIRVRVMSMNPDELVAPFRTKDETSLWQSEFWGKWTLGAIDAYRYNRNPELLKKITSGVSGILATQLPDGYIGNYKPESRLSGWDVWGQKYTLLALISYYDLTGDKKAIEGACRLADYVLAQIPSKVQIERAGYYRGMPPSSILEPIVYLYNRTKNQKYLDFARYIVGRWETPDGPQLISKALAGVPVADRFPIVGAWNHWYCWDNGQKAYEMMSCYEGLLELYKIDPKSNYLKAIEMTVQNIMDEEINIAGSGSAFECFYHGRSRQTEPTYHTMETCVTMTWMKLCKKLLEVTHNAQLADQIERSAYNALSASMKDDGSQIAKYSPLEGMHSAGEEQCGMHVNCCNMNGPRAFTLLPDVAVEKSGDTLYVNLYGPSQTTVTMASGPVTLTQTTDYPQQGNIEIAIDAAKNSTFAIALRIPAWSAVSSVAVNGEASGNVKAGSYLTLRRKWNPDDKITLNFDLRGRLIEQDGYQAIERGPIVLARDSRFGDGDVDEASIIQSTDGQVDLLPTADTTEGMWMSYTAPLVLGTDLEGDAAKPTQVKFCDFSSAGNNWNRAVRYRVWLKKTLNVIFLKH